MNKCILALSTALTIMTAAPVLAQNNNQAPAAVDCTLAANATDPACMKSSTSSSSTTTTGTVSQPTTSAMSNELIVPADRLNNAKVMSANDYIGKTVYDQNGKNIGEVNDLIISEDGQINAVILGVGGFLGIGEKDVAVSMHAVKMVPDETTASTTTAADGTTTTTTTTNNTTTADNTTAAIPARNMRLVVNTTKEALNAAPTYDRTNRRYLPANQ